MGHVALQMTSCSVLALCLLLSPTLVCRGAQIGPPTDPADTVALRKFNDEVIKATGVGIPGWFPANQSQPCGDAYSNPPVYSYPGVLCPYGQAGQAAPVNVLSLVLYDKGITATTIAPITGLRKLTGLALVSNNFSGPLPPGLASLSQLANVDLRNNQFSGPIPDLTGAPLRVLFLANQTWGGGEGLSGPLPAFLGTMTTLSLLDLSLNSLSGPIPSGLVNLPQLNTLYLRGNSLSGRIPNLGPLAGTLQGLDLSRNPFERGPIPSELNSLTMLNGVLDLSYMNLVGGLVDLRDLGAIVDLILDGNQLSGPLVTSKLPVGSLGFLSIRNNKFSGKISPKLLDVLNNNIYCLSSCGIVFANNSFTGSLPASLGDILQAFVFDFSYNRLTGTIPNKYGYIYAMLQLLLQNNRLSGALPDFNPPPSVSYQLALVQLNVANNQLSKTVPENLSRFTRLQTINLSNNRFYGTMPALSVLTRLTYLNVSRNSLSGIPPAYPAVKEFDVSRNFFGGLYSDFNSSYSPGVQLDARFNCFKCPPATRPAKSKGYYGSSSSKCTIPPQRSSKECRAFCMADSIQPPCGGHGVCVVWPGSKKPKCMCDQGYVHTGNTCQTS